jgi:hypothetical protein
MGFSGIAEKFHEAKLFPVPFWWMLEKNQSFFVGRRQKKKQQKLRSFHAEHDFTSFHFSEVKKANAGEIDIERDVLWFEMKGFGFELWGEVRRDLVGMIDGWRRRRLAIDFQMIC